MKKRALILAICSLTVSAFASDSSTGKESGWKIDVEAPKASAAKAEKALWGLSVGAYFPVDGEIRDLFGSSMPRFGLSPVSRKFDKKFDISTDVNILWVENDTARLFILPVTIGAVLGVGGSSAQGFVSVNTGPAYMDYVLYRSNGKGFDTFSTRKIGWNANIEVGLLLNKRLSITGRYDWYSKSDDFDFSGYSFNINFAVFRW